LQPIQPPHLTMGGSGSKEVVVGGTAATPDAVARQVNAVRAFEHDRAHSEAQYREA